MTNAAAPRVMRACVSTYAALAGPPAASVVVTLCIILFKNRSEGWPLLAVFCVYFLVMLTIVTRYRVVLQGETVTYRSPLASTRALTRAEIAHARVDVRFFKQTRREQSSLRPPIALVVEPLPEVSKPPLIINMKVFSRADLRDLFAFFGDKFLDTDQRMAKVVGKGPKRTRPTPGARNA